MDVTGWINGEVFLQTIDEGEVEQITAYLTQRGLGSQVMTMNEQMTLDPLRPDDAVTRTSYSIMVQIAGFPQMVTQTLTELMERAHGAGWTVEPDAD